jgi:ribosome maturation factor RimP
MRQAQKEGMATGIYDREKELTRQVTREVEQSVPGVEVLALELVGRERFRVYIDHPGGVDLALCERVSGVLRGYSDSYSVEVSSPGLERPLRRPAHFARHVGRPVILKTADEIGGKTKFRGELLAADDRSVRVAAGAEPVEIPYDAIVRANLIDSEGA